MIDEQNGVSAKILIVDDEHDVIELISNALPDSYKVYSASSGQQALTMLKDNTVDVILLDAVMPGMSGFEFMQQLADNDITSKVTVIIMTEADDKQQTHALLSGAADIISKPVNHQVLVTRVNNHILLKQSQNQADKSIDELNKSKQELEAFSYSVSHDLRAPLRAISGFSSILQSQYAASIDDKGLQLLDRVIAASGRMSQMIDDLLALSRITQAELQLETVDVSLMAGEVVAQIQGRYSEHPMEVEIQPQLVTVADPKLLRITLESLLDNAFKYTQKTEHPRLSVGSALHEGVNEFYIKDNGAGFDMQYAGKMFGVFQRLHTAADFEGEGVGLTKVLRIVNRHGGSIRAEAEPDKGATFYFQLGNG